MKFIIHGNHPDGTPDQVTLEGESIEEIREKADKEVESRRWTNLWSEKIED